MSGNASKCVDGDGSRKDGGKTEKEDTKAAGRSDGEETIQAPVVSDYRCAVLEMEESYEHLDEDLIRELIPNSPDERSGSEYELLLHTSVTRDFMVSAGSMKGGLPIFKIEEREGSDSDSDEEKIKDPKDVEPKLPNWKHGDFTKAVTPPDENIILKEKHNGTPLEVFLSFFTEELILHIVDQTNLYGTQKHGTPPNISANDFLKFLSVEINMGIVKTSYTDIWSDDFLGFENKIPDIMPMEEYQRIQKSLHFANNAERANCDDRYFKIRPVFEYLRQKFNEIDVNEKKFVVNDMKLEHRTIRFRKKTLRSYYQIFYRSGVSGLVYDMLLWEKGDKTFHGRSFAPNVATLSFRSKVVACLTKSIPIPSLSVVFISEDFNSPNLMHFLRHEYGIFSIGPLENERLQGAEELLENDQALRRRGRGSHDVVANGDVCVMKWTDKSGVVTVGSSYAGLEPKSTILRRSKETRKKAPVECPQIIKEWDKLKNAGRHDDLVDEDKTPTSKYKWYMTIFSQLLNLCLTNSYAIYKLGGSKMSSIKFKQLVADGLLLFEIPSTESSSPPKWKRLDTLDHMPCFGAEGECRKCHSHQTKTTCSKCEVPLCVAVKRNCFYDFHTKLDI